MKAAAVAEVAGRHASRPMAGLWIFVGVLVAQAASLAWEAGLGQKPPFDLAAGWAFACALLHPRRALLPVAAGLALAHGATQAGGFQAGPWAAGVALAALPPCLGAALYWRLQRRPPRLVRPRELLAFVLSASAAALLAGALAAALDAAGSPQALRADAQWLGLLIVAPAVLAWIGRPRPDWQPRRVAVGVVLPVFAACLALGLALYGRMHRDHEHALFVQAAARVGNALKLKLQGTLDALEALRSALELQPAPAPADFEQAVQPWVDRHRLLALGVSQRLEPADISRFEGELQALGAPEPRVRNAVGDGTTRPLSEGDTVWAIRLIAPWDLNAQVLGVNSWANPPVAEAMRRALESGQAAATRSFPLKLRDGPARGAVVYRNTAHHAAPPRLVFVTLRFDSLLAELKAILPAGFEFCLREDVGDGNAEPLLASAEGACAARQAAPLRTAAALPFAQRTWQLEVLSGPQAGLPETAWVARLATTALAVMALLLLSVSGHARIVQAAARRAQAAHALAERASRAKSEFLARMSHELRTPLNAILGYAQLLRRTRAGSRELGHIETAGWHLQQLIDDLLDLGRIEIGQMALQHDPLAVEAVLQDAVSMVAPLAERYGVSLRREPVPPGLAFRADARRVVQIVVNLLTNGVKYNREGGRVTLAVACTPGQVALRVSDTGVGMTAAQLQSLFEPFNRLGREASAVEGSGIGLHLSHRLATGMGGSLSASSTPGQGSVFVLTLERAPDQPAPLAPTESTMPPVRTIAAFEDEALAQELLASLFGELPGLRLVCRARGAGAAEWLRAEKAEVVLLDLTLADTDGWSVLAEIRAQPDLASLPVLVTSAETGTGLRAGQAAVAGFQPKPWDLDSLQAAVQALLDRPRA